MTPKSLTLKEEELNWLKKDLEKPKRPPKDTCKILTNIRNWLINIESLLSIIGMKRPKLSITELLIHMNTSLILPKDMLKMEKLTT